MFDKYYIFNVISKSKLLYTRAKINILFILSKNLSKKIYYNFIAFDLIISSKYISIDIEIDFYKSKKFNNNISSYLKKNRIFTQKRISC